MPDILTDNIFFGIITTIAAFALGRLINRKTGLTILNPFLVAFLLLMAMVLLLKIPLAHYMKGASWLEQMLPVSIILLALPLFRQRSPLHLHKVAIIAGITAGVITNLISTILLCRLFNLDEVLLRSLIPRSITTPLGMLMTENISGVSSITMITIIVNGLFGVIFYTPHLYHFPYSSSHCQRHCHGNNLPCHRNWKSPGTGRGYRSHERACHCTDRSDNRSGLSSYKSHPGLVQTLIEFGKDKKNPAGAGLINHKLRIRSASGISRKADP